MTSVVIDWPDRWIDLPLAVLDVETTGLDCEVDRIIEIAILRFEKGEITDKLSTLVNPERPISQESIDITGIKPEDVVDKPTFEQLAPRVNEMLATCGICAYNLSFDRGFIRAELERCGLAWPEDNPTLDPLIFARQFFKNSPRKNLSAISKLLGIPLRTRRRGRG